ncbi:MAG TPA: sugar-binding domain-containing protein [Methylomirabilota bacterium]|nr:sugar-binding domain-containing protein [Methylomirabilota bacterium]
MSPDAVALMVRIGRLYYEQGLTQQAIARATRLSRPTVSRLLERGRRTGIVTIRIQDPRQPARALEEVLARRFGLQQAILTAGEADADQEPRRSVGQVAATYLQSVLRDGMTVGVTWGKTLSEMALCLKPAHLARLTVVQMVGGLAVLEDTLDTTGLAKEVGRVLGGRTVQFLAPAFVEDADVRRTIRSTRPVRQVMDFLRRLDMAVVGIGAVSPHVPLVERGYLTPERMARCRRAGARGEVLLQFYDAVGRPLPPLNRSLIGMRLEDLPRVPVVVAVVSGPPDKTEAVLGALRGGLVHVLVTDLETARRVLEAADRERPPAPPTRADGRARRDGPGSGGRRRPGR